MDRAHSGVQEKPVDLNIDQWLYEHDPVPGCGVCTALAKQYRNATTHDEKFDASKEIRNHPHPEK